MYGQSIRDKIHFFFSFFYGFVLGDLRFLPFFAFRTYRLLSNRPYNRVPFQQDGEFKWEAELQERLRSAFSWGFVLTQLVGGRLAGVLGGKLLLLLGVVLAAVLTLLVPVAAVRGPYWLLAARIMIGAAQVGPNVALCCGVCE